MDLKVDGNEPDLAKNPTGKVMRSKALGLWYQDPVEIVEELIGNPKFHEVMKYAPEQVYVVFAGPVHRTELNQTMLRSIFQLQLPEFGAIPVAGC